MVTLLGSRLLLLKHIKLLFWWRLKSACSRLPQSSKQTNNNVIHWNTTVCVFVVLNVTVDAREMERDWDGVRSPSVGGRYKRVCVYPLLKSAPVSGTNLFCTGNQMYCCCYSQINALVCELSCTFCGSCYLIVLGRFAIQIGHENKFKISAHMKLTTHVLARRYRLLARICAN